MEHAEAANKLKNRFPQINFSEISKKRASIFQTDGKYMAIPRGKKYYAWFTFYKTYNVCVFINKATGDLFYEKVSYSPLSLGTVLYGTLVDYKTHFISENIFFYEGRPVEKCNIEQKLDLFLKMMRLTPSSEGYIMPQKTKISIAPMWCGIVPPSFYCETTTHHIFELCDAVSLEITPAKKNGLENLQNSERRERSDFTTPSRGAAPPQSFEIKKDKIIKNSQNTHFTTPSRGAAGKIVKSAETAPPPTQEKISNKPQQTRIFFVKADITNDIYHLYVKTDRELPNQHNLKHHSIAFIPDYKTSVYMNKIFRKIRENDNLDYIEESDDEDFEDTRYDKYVYLDKIERMTCVYNYKFKKWVPVARPL